MNTGSTSVLGVRDDLSRFDVQIALGGFLAGNSNIAYLAYQQDPRQFVSRCRDQDLELFTVKRTHIELFCSLGGTPTHTTALPMQEDQQQRPSKPRPTIPDR